MYYVGTLAKLVKLAGRRWLLRQGTNLPYHSNDICVQFKHFSKQLSSGLYTFELVYTNPFTPRENKDLVRKS